MEVRAVLTAGWKEEVPWGRLSEDPHGIDNVLPPGLAGDQMGAGYRRIE